MKAFYVYVANHESDHVDIMLNTFFCAGKQIRPTTIAQEPKDTRVLVGAGQNHAIIEGNLSAMPSFQKLHGSNEFQELWTVTCADSTFCEFHDPLLHINV
jgi:hypothetical protein